MYVRKKEDKKKKHIEEFLEGYGCLPKQHARKK